MRIVHFNAGGPEFHDRPYQYDAHHVHMIDELRRAGHEVLHINPAGILGRYDTPDVYGEVTVARVREFQAEGGCDLFFATAVDHALRPDAVQEIGRLGIPTLNLDIDDLTHPYRVKKITPAFDLVWTSVRENEALIRRYGARKLVQMPFAANPHTFHPVAADSETRAVCFVGACYGARARSVATLSQNDVPVRVYGTSPFDVYGAGQVPVPALRALSYYQEGWERLFKSLSYATGRTCIRAMLARSVETMVRDVPEKHLKNPLIEYHPGPSFEDMPTCLAEHAISLGSLEVSSTFVLKQPLFTIRFREFEAPMCGAVHLANGYPELKEYFEEDREMIFYHSLEELTDKARFWLDPARDTARQEIRRRARARSEGEHTWRHRFRRCLDLLGIHQPI